MKNNSGDNLFPPGCGGACRRPWGYFEVLSEGPGHKVKRITIDRGRRVSLQQHVRRHEHWVVVAGRALVTLGGRELTLAEGGSLDIPPGTVHRITSIGERPLVFIEVQRGDYLEEDDIERFEDDYGRVIRPRY